MRLEGHNALVIGYTGRLGPIWTQTLSEAGARVWKAGPAPDDGLVQVDCASPSSVARLCATLDPLIPDIVVYNAGVDSRPDLQNLDDQAEQMARVNLIGADGLLRHLGSRMAARGRGSIILIASLYGLVAPDLRYYDHRPDGWTKDAMYGATKAGLIALTRDYAARYGPSGVRVNALAPGGVVAEGDQLTAQDATFAAKYTARIPLGRMCRPDDLMGPLLFLASDASRFVTGQTLVVDGGYTCW